MTLIAQLDTVLAALAAYDAAWDAWEAAPTNENLRKKVSAGAVLREARSLRAASGATTEKDKP